MATKPENDFLSTNNSPQPSNSSDFRFKNVADTQGKESAAENSQLTLSELGLETKDFTSPAFDIVALTASADGLNALSQVLSVLPADFPVPIVVVQHLSPRHRSLMANILNRRTLLSVEEAEEGCILMPGMVFIAPPDHHLLVNPDGSLSLSQTAKVHFVRPAAEILFQSVAEVYKERAIAVVLTGGDSDGSTGVRLIKQMGGKVIAQDKTTSKVWGMPSAAIRTGCVDWVLPLCKIGAAIVSLVRNEEVAGESP